MVPHPGVDKVAFTGSTAAGRLIAKVCAGLLPPVTLELGGKSAAILVVDVDMDTIWPNLQFVTFIKQRTDLRDVQPAARTGQPTRRDRDAVASRVSQFVVGNPLDRNVEIGLMASEAHRARVEGYIEKGKSKAKWVAGGGRPKGLDRGWFVEPTVFAYMSNSATVAQEEIFGPVLSVIPYDDEQDALRLANDSVYGLVGSVFSADAERAKDVARRVHTRTIRIDGYPAAIGSPFGGVKDSGIGREFGPEALSSYLDLKSMYISG